MKLFRPREKTANKEPRWRFRRILGAPRRLARRRGFGVHSPFAYDFIRRVISQPCAYYCYPRLLALSRRSGMRPSALRLIFRLSLFFRPEKVAVEGCDDIRRNAIISALAEGMPDARCVVADPDLTVVCDDDHAGEALQCALRGGVVVLSGNACTRSTARSLWNATRCGMMFRSSDMVVFVGLDHLPHQLYNVWI